MALDDAEHLAGVRWIWQIGYGVHAALLKSSPEVLNEVLEVIIDLEFDVGEPQHTIGLTLL